MLDDDLYIEIILRRGQKVSILASDKTKFFEEGNTVFEDLVAGAMMVKFLRHWADAFEEDNTTANVEETQVELWGDSTL